jgi:hypothetical protein
MITSSQKNSFAIYYDGCLVDYFFNTAVGNEHLMRQFGIHTQHQKIRGIGKAKTLLKHA